MKKALIPVLVIAVFLLSACTLPFSVVWNTPAPESAPATELPAVTEAPAVVVTEAPQQFEGYQTNQGGVAMVVPACLGSSVTGVIVPAVTSAEGPYYSLNPEYRQITIEGYPLSGKFWEPEVKVYPVADFLALDQDNIIGREITGLQSILGSQNIPADEDLPFIGPMGAAQAFHARASIINFQNGQGIGYLAEYAQYYVPANNMDLFYTFQGLTGDGNYWIAATFPVTATFLQETSDYEAVVPAGGIAMPDPSTAPQAEVDAYYPQVVNLLSSAPDGQFTPTISCITTFIESINITN
jgi:hypothetical protein